MQYVFDATGSLAANRIPNELQTITAANGVDHNYIVPTHAPFFGASLAVVDVSTGIPLTPNVDYELTHKFQELSDKLAIDIFGSFTFLDPTIDPTTNGNYRLVYQTVGGDFTDAINEVIPNGLSTLQNLRSLDWSKIANIPAVFPPAPHLTPILGIEAVTEIINQFQLLTAAVAQPPSHIHLDDVEDLRSEYVTPLMENLVGIRNAILGNAGAANLYHEISTPANTRTDIGSIEADTWKDTGLQVSVLKEGSFMVHMDTNITTIPSTNATIRQRFVIDNIPDPRGYSNHTVLGLGIGMVVKLQIKLVGASATNVFIADAEHSSSLSIQRLGV